MSRYRQIVTSRLEGDPAEYGVSCPGGRSSGYFPAYLLKCLQDHFRHHGNELCDELKHLRNALELVCSSLRFAEKAQTDSRHIETLAAVHRLLAIKESSRPPDPRQLTWC